MPTLAYLPPLVGTHTIMVSHVILADIKCQLSFLGPRSVHTVWLTLYSRSVKIPNRASVIARGLQSSKTLTMLGHAYPTISDATLPTRDVESARFYVRDAILVGQKGTGDWAASMS